ncbi:MAG TPA: CocE/NonD family hydrolase [Planctomycetota bacterium]|nr:CocE/NonD family hydrolase [Planctomycetota bacterium]
MPHLEIPEPELLMVPMSDGAKLAVHRYAAAKSPAPAIVQFTPYRKEGAYIKGKEFADKGFDFYMADVRGFGASTGPYHGLLSEREVQDGVELIEWIAKQSSCNGKVALSGGSYTGANQMLIAARKPKGLACIAPMVGPVDTYRDWTRRGGIWTFAVWGLSYFRGGQRETLKKGLEHYFLEVMADEFDNDGHRKRSPEYVFSKIEVPALCSGGWYDYFLRGTIRSYMQIKSPRRLVVGPWGHASWQDDGHVEWFRYWTTGQGDDPTKKKAVRLYNTGTGEWTERDTWFNFETAKFTEWKPFESDTRVRILPTLAGLNPPPNIRPEYVLDSGFGWWPEVFTVEGEPFKKDADIDGPMALEAHVRADACDDFEIHARVSVVKKDGTSVMLNEGRLRAAHRANDIKRSVLNSEGVPILTWHPHDKAEKMPPGEFVKINIEINPAFHRVAAGERLRLGISLVRACDPLVPSEAIIGKQTRVLLPVNPA